MELSPLIVLAMVGACAIIYWVGRYPFSKPKGILKSMLYGLKRVVLIGLAIALPAWLTVPALILGIANVIRKKNEKKIDP